MGPTGMYSFLEKRTKNEAAIEKLVQDVHGLCQRVMGSSTGDLADTLWRMNSFDVQAVKKCTECFRASDYEGSIGMPKRLVNIPHSSLDDSIETADREESCARIDAKVGQLNAVMAKTIVV